MNGPENIPPAPPVLPAPPLVIKIPVTTPPPPAPSTPSALRTLPPVAERVTPMAAPTPAPAPASAATAAAPGRISRRLKDAPLSVKDWALRILLILLLAGAGSLLTWSYLRLVPVQQQARELNTLVGRLSLEIGMMEGKYSPKDLEKLAADYRDARGLLFSGEDAVAKWFTGLKQQMVPLALDATADFGKPTAQTAANQTLAVVPATLSLNIQPAELVEAVGSPYDRLLRFMDQLAQQSKRVDLVELQVQAGSNSVSRAVATLELWAGEETSQ